MTLDELFAQDRTAPSAMKAISATFTNCAMVALSRAYPRPMPTARSLLMRLSTPTLMPLELNSEPLNPPLASRVPKLATPSTG